MDHPLNEVLAELKTLLVLQHLSELCDHLGDPATKEITLNDDEYCTVITENKIWYTTFLKYYNNTGLSSFLD
jgi:CO dehydrogenase/acetyl-CoA synthase gamma subunit (corrinoid Fe-S protein)